jgi:hypothetical protein
LLNPVFWLAVLNSVFIFAGATQRLHGRLRTQPQRLRAGRRFGRALLHSVAPMRCLA